MHLPDDPRKLPLPLTCYCDDSGSHDEARVAVVSATLMSRPRCTEFNYDWKKILKEFRIEGVHMRDFVRPYGRYVALPGEMKRALFTSVAKTINLYKTYSVSVAVPQSDYKALLSTNVCRELMGPYAMAFLTVILINRECCSLRKHNSPIAYLIDKGSPHHHDQLEAAHTAILQLEKSRCEKYTGAISTDLDDKNNALQAADVVAWAYHRQLESSEFGSEFGPLLNIFNEYQLSPFGKKVRPHVIFEVPRDGITIFANLINNWISRNGDTPTWEQLSTVATNRGGRSDQ
jgi:Protein of unknown function (DUF3800)